MTYSISFRGDVIASQIQREYLDAIYDALRAELSGQIDTAEGQHLCARVDPD